MSRKHQIWVVLVVFVSAQFMPAMESRSCDSSCCQSIQTCCQMPENSTRCQMKDYCQPSDCPCPMMQKVNLEDVNSDEFVVSAKVKITDNLAMNTVFVPLAENLFPFSSQSFQISKTEKPLVIPLRI